MTFDYFYGRESGLFSFMRVPKVLFTEDRFKQLSAESKLLYGLLLDRMCLSAENGWFDEKRRVFIVYTIDEVQLSINCGSKKAVAIMKELEECGLIEKKRQGLSKPNLIYVKNFATELSKGKIKNCQKDNSGVVQKEIKELSKAQSINTDLNNTDLSDTDSVQFYSRPLRIYSKSSSITGQNRNESMDDAKQYQMLIEDNISLDILKERYPQDAGFLDEIASLILDVVCSNRDKILVGREQKSINLVKSQFLKLNSFHIEYVLERLNKNTTEITNMRQYLITVLYNAPMTMDGHYKAMVNHDRANRLTGGNNE